MDITSTSRRISISTFFKEIIYCFCFLLTACVETPTYAPVAEVCGIDPIPKSGFHRVTKGETLYAIAWRYGLDYRDLVRSNHIENSYAIHPGQILSLRRDYSTQKKKIASQPKTTVIMLEPQMRQEAPVQEKIATNLRWVMPTRGKILNYYSTNHKGINISNSLGEPIYAAAAGKIVYCGHGLRGYGNLIIIKHDNLYFSAYAHNQRVFVKEGDLVKQRQKIAEMGSTGTDQVMLHFEIRRAGKPIDPLNVLKR